MYVPIGANTTPAAVPPSREPRRTEADRGTDADRDAEGFYAGGDGEAADREGPGGSGAQAREQPRAGGRKFVIRELGEGRLDVTV